MKEWVTLILGLVWPLTVVGILIGQRATVRRLLSILELRFARDKVSAFGVTLEPPDPKLGLPILNPPQVAQGSTKTNVVMQALAVSPQDDVLLVLGESYHTDPSSAVGTGDALALAAVQAALIRSGINNVSAAVVRSRYANVSNVLREHNKIVSLGGPWGNKLSKAVVATRGLNYSFQDEGVLDATTGEIHVSVINKSLNGTDFGIILAMPSPFNDEGRVIMAAGYHAFGTFAAASILADVSVPPVLQQLVGHPFEALVRAIVKNGVVRTSEVIAARRIDAAAA